MRARLTPALIALLVACALPGCAYFNTFYSAKKNFEAAEIQRAQSTDDPEDRANAGQAGLYDKAIEGATKILVDYPKSKWVDDALLLIGRSMLAKGDYAGAQRKFQELGTNFPKSDLKADATFWSAVAADRDRRPEDALALYDSVLANYPKSKNYDTARYRRSGLFLTMKQAGKAVDDLKDLSGRKGEMGYDAGLKLADALYAQRDYTGARAEYLRVAERAPTEQQRLEARLRAGDCEEASGDYAAASESYLRLLRDSRTDDGRARARLRYGNALALGGNVEQGLTELKNVVEDYPRTAYAAEALFRQGYLNEVVKDDLNAAATAYGLVPEQAPGSPYAVQAQVRRDNLAKAAEATAATRDTTPAGRAAEAAMRQAENELFQLSHPEKALEAYEKAATANPNGPLAPRATYARGWVLARRLGKPDEAKAAFESVVAKWPQSNEAKAARHMLEAPNDSTTGGGPLAVTAMQFPLVPGNPMYEPPPPVTATTKRTSAPKTAIVGKPAGPGTDSLAVVKLSPADSAAAAAAAQADSLRMAKLRAQRDSVRAARKNQP